MYLRTLQIFKKTSENIDNQHLVRLSRRGTVPWWRMVMGVSQKAPSYECLLTVPNECLGYQNSRYMRLSSIPRWLVQCMWFEKKLGFTCLQCKPKMK